MKEVFSRRVVDVDVDPRREVMHYTVKDQFDEIHDEGFSKIILKPVAVKSYTWDEVDKIGISGIKDRLKNVYGNDIVFI